jgi:hypothetical protein
LSDVALGPAPAGSEGGLVGDHGATLPLAPVGATPQRLASAVVSAAWAARFDWPGGWAVATMPSPAAAGCSPTRAASSPLLDGAEVVIDESQDGAGIYARGGSCTSP